MNLTQTIANIKQHYLDTLQTLPAGVTYAPNYIITDVPLDQFKELAGKKFHYNHHAENLHHSIELSSIASIGVFSVKVGQPVYSEVNFGY